MMSIRNFVVGIICCGFILLMAAPSALGQSVFSKPSAVKQTCGACHKPDEKGKLEVIEETRKTPEEWKVVIHRMINLNHAPVDEAVFYPIVKELSRHLCLSPTEMKKVAYINSDENNQMREIPADKTEERIFAACVRCHTFAKIASHRMTAQQWLENRTLHLGYYPTSVPQMREMDWLKETQELADILAKLFPFDDPGWRQWQQSRSETNLDGQWRLAGYQPGLGYYEGFYDFKPNPDKGPDEYLVRKQVRYLNGPTLKFSGTAVLYSGYHLRYALAPTALTGRIEGVFDLEAAESMFSGKWWTEVQDTNAFGNEVFYQVDKSMKVVAVFPQALKADDSSVQELTVAGFGFPEDLGLEDITFSDANIKVTAIKRISGFNLVCQTAVGGQDRQVKLKVKDAAYRNPLTVFTKIDGLSILPKIGRARVSCGAAYPPQGVQFVARAVQFGPDGKPNTADDVLLEPVSADWWLEEEKTRENDDDLKYLQAPVANGLYTPVTTYGPIQARKQNREGVGLIAVGASAKIGDKVLKDRALLAVTVPDFITHIK